VTASICLGRSGGHAERGETQLNVARSYKTTGGVAKVIVKRSQGTIEGRQVEGCEDWRGETWDPLYGGLGMKKPKPNGGIGTKTVKGGGCGS